MSGLRFLGLPSPAAASYRDGGGDANGQPAERHLSDGSGNPCRHCLEEIAAGLPMLVLAHRPFPAPQSYAEIGPIFLHAERCDPHPAGSGVPAMFLTWERLLIRGYGSDDRIVYGSGRIAPTGELADAAAALLERPEIVYLHARSAANNCWQCRIERGA